MELEERVNILEKKLAALYLRINVEIPSMDLIRKLEEQGVNFTVKDKLQ